jgi:DNA-binding transcriptional regulator YiaG
LSLFQLQHLSNKGQLFPSLLDRLPSRENPAYEDYCRSQGISKDEDNLLVLLGTIGKRGPSSFIFEPVYNVEELTPEKIVKFRTSLGMTQHDFAAAFDFSKITINRLEAGHSQDPGSLARIKIYLEFPEVPLWQLKQTGGRIHGDVLAKATAELHRRMRRA